MLRSIYVRENIGLGDGVQFSSLPENYHAEMGKNLTVESYNWFFDFNPFVSRTSVPYERIHPWERITNDPLPNPLFKEFQYNSNAEIGCSLLGLKKVKLTRPRLYRYEDTYQTDRIVFHPHGISQGTMPQNVIDHIVNKYGERLVQVGIERETQFVRDCYYPNNFWDLARFISQSSGFIGMSSGPSWVAACFPKVWNKVIRGPYPKLLQRTPLDIRNLDSIWDDYTIFDFYNTTEHDISFTKGFKGI